MNGIGRGGQGLPSSVKRVLVLGASRSGLAAASTLVGAARRVVLVDRRSREQLVDVSALEERGVEFMTEEALLAAWPEVQLVVKSPGVPEEASPVRCARERGVPVWSEIELAYALFLNPFDAITGTNGKTTTTALLGHIFRTAGRPSRVLGNIGTAVTSIAGEVGDDEELVVEVSSFQLEDVHEFRPAVGVFLNLTPDHLDRHGTMAHYLECKARLFARQGPDDTAVLNLDDEAVRGLGEVLRAKDEGPRVAYFSTLSTGNSECAAAASQPGPDSWIEDGWMFLDGRPALQVAEIQIPGRHNLENCLAAGTAALARGVPIDAVAQGLRTFTGVEHRLEQAGIIDGVTYVNDSKATNVEATLTALKAYPENTHLILGGRDKASDYRPVARACASACRGVYLIGEATPLIEQAFAEVETNEPGMTVPFRKDCGDLENALRTARAAAKPGDVILLAPACASFDQYRSFEQRGEHFRDIVHALMRETR